MTKPMKIRLRLSLVLLVLASNWAHAQLLPNVNGLIPTAVARPLIEQNPSVAAARAGLEAARQQAGILDKSPHEWTAKAMGQRRSIQSGQNYGEWSLGLERTLRLASKGMGDRSLGLAIVAEFQARYGEALHESARELLAHWLDWLGAERTRGLAADNLQAVQENLLVVEKRVRAGDASRLDANLARAELAEQRRAENDARTLAGAASARLSARFPGFSRADTTLPSSAALAADEAALRERIMAESDELKIVEANLLKATAQAERERADRRPDPTFGVHVTSEAGGRERILGVSISVPLPGGVRDLRNAKALAEVDVASNLVALKKRQLEAEIAGALVTARGNHESLQMAQEGMRAMQDNARLVQRAYSLGEGDLQALLLARRQASSVAASALQAQMAALKSYYGLLVDAHLVWDLERE